MRLLQLAVPAVAFLFSIAAVGAQEASGDRFIQTAASYAVIMDYETGEVLYQKNADAPMAPASMSKLMTTELLFQRLKGGEYGLDDTFYVSEKAWRMGGSKMWVLVDTRVRIEDLIRGVVVQSGNDAAVVIAEALAGTEEAFADMMTVRARDLGMRSTKYTNATGWPDPEHISSPRDIAILARHIVSEYPDYYGYYSEREFTWSDIRQPNRNPILSSVRGADGLKTGHTEEAGYGLVGTAERDGERRIVVVHGLGSERERASEAKRMLEIAFNDFGKEKVFRAGDIVGEAEVWLGAADTAALELRHDADVIVHRLARRELTGTVVYEGPLEAPIRAGDQVATLRIAGPGVEPHLLPLYAANDVASVGFFGKVVFALDRLIFGDSLDEIRDAGAARDAAGE